MVAKGTPLKKILLTAKNRPQVVARCVKMIEDEVNKKSGFSGMAIKGGYIVVKNLKGGQMIPEAVDWLLDDFVEKMEDTASSYVKGGGQLADGQSLSAHFSRNGSTLAEALLEVTDDKAAKGHNAVLINAYKKLRPLAASQVKEALPGIAKVIAESAK